MRDTYDTTVIVEGSPEVERLLDANAQGVLFYIAEEAVNNARKHAQSSHIWVRLLPQNGAVAVEIEDDGVGFDVQAVGTGYEQRGSLGMVNMRERAELIQGTLHIDSTPGKGTRIRVLVPLRPATDSGEEQAAAPPLELQSQRAAQRTPGRGIKPLPAQRKGASKPVTGPLKPLPARTRAGKTSPLPPPPEPDTEKGP